MARTINRLKPTQISRLGPGRHHDGLGLYLVVGKETARSWIFRFYREGRLRDFGLGPTHTITLAEAREVSLELRRGLRDGINPIEARKAARLQSSTSIKTMMTFAKATEQTIAFKAAEWRGTDSEKDWHRTLSQHAFPILGNLPVSAINTALVLQVLNQPDSKNGKPFWTEKTVTATRVRERIEAVLDWATPEHRQGDNPARWRGVLDKKLAKPSKAHKREGHEALSFTQIGTFMTELRNIEGSAARALEFAILTAGRTDEILGARWDEIDLDDLAWTVPSERMKAGKEHRVPLSDAAFRVIETMKTLRINEYVFPGRNGRQGPQAMLRLVKKLRPDLDLTVHGFRATFLTWADETTAHTKEINRAAIAHIIDNASDGAYSRGDRFEKRRLLMDDWASFCAITERPRPRLVVGR